MHTQLCNRCYKDLDKTGIAREVYCSVVEQYAGSNNLVKVSGKWVGVVDFLEKKGYLITHELECGDVFVKPLKTTCDHTIFCKRCH